MPKTSKYFNGEFFMIDTKDQLEDITLEIKEMYENIENLKSCVDLFDIFVEKAVEV